MIVRDIMSKEIAWVSSDDSIERAAQMMKLHDVGSVPVCSNGKVVGIVTDRDITLRSTATGQSGKQQKVCDVMSSYPALGSPDMDIHDATKIMSEKQIRRLPIVENDRLVGMVALGDVSVQPSLQDNAEMALKNISQCNKHS